MRGRWTPLVVTAVCSILAFMLAVVAERLTRRPAEQAAAPATSCELDLIEARDYIGDLEQEVADLRERLEARP